jgi:hypothetical protein
MMWYSMTQLDVCGPSLACVASKWLAFIAAQTPLMHQRVD